MTAESIYIEATRRGLILEPRSDERGVFIAVIPKGKCPPEFANTILAHKPELLDWLKTKDTWVRKLRDTIYHTFDPKTENFCSDRNWEACKENWLQPQNVLWLIAQQPKTTIA